MRTTLLSIGLVAANMGHAQLGPEHRFAYPVEGTHALAAHDMDGDGDDDFVYNASGRLWLYEQVSSDNFAMRQDLGSVTDARHIRTGDVDGDGIQDLVLLDNAPSRIALLRVFGDGTFGVIQDLITSIPEMRDIRLADLDGDGDLDIIVMSDNPYSLIWWANDGAGAFGASETVLSGTAPYGLQDWNTFALGDLDGDGDPDLATPMDGGADSLMVLLNDGSGSFTIGSTVTAGTCHETVAADMDGDGYLDLVVYGPDYPLRRITNYRGHGDGTFGPGAVLAYIGDDWTGLSQLWPEDMDGDGDIDLLAMERFIGGTTSYFVQGWRNEGGGSFSYSFFCPQFGTWTNHPFCTMDANGSGQRDVLCTTPFAIFSSTGPNVSTLVSSAPGPAHIQALLRQGSTLPDAVVSGSSAYGSTTGGIRPPQLTVHRNPGNGLVEQQPALVLEQGDAGRILGMRTANMDLDGDEDLLTTREFSAWDVVSSQSSILFEGDGAPIALPLTGLVGYVQETMDTYSPAIRDVDMDGDMDVVGHNGYGMLIHLNVGDGSFAGISESDMLFPMVPPRWLDATTLCDVDADGDPDFISAIHDSLFVNLNTGDGTPEPDASFLCTFSGASATYLTGMDMNLDGLEDIVVMGDGLSVLYNIGGGQFIEGTTWPGSGFTHEFGDIDGNGYPDVVSLASDGDITYYPNYGSGNIGDGTVLITGPEHTGRSDISLADMDGDGDLDVLTCSSTGSAAWLGNPGDLPTGALPVSHAFAGIRLFPSPMTDVARLVMPEPLGADARIDLIDASGRSLRTLNGNGSSAVVIERGHLESGLYVVRVMRGGEHLGSARMIVE